ncbi:hypothetical protein B0I35DRAFT_439096 [Stachybotrys elegans]|uniref:Uncharacterized protein n=1 Tax=Stachybotrys elegans TaxID=80388 RepID=A0A8K0SJV0_9HYPO|nr:hypothetical protein B0I35DRAFT_439096 [Stachybotrys elegans]
MFSPLAYRTHEDTAREVRNFHFEDNPMSCDCLYSFAPLDNVEWVQGFYPEGEDPEKCHGLIFHYNNGSAKSVGECRVQAHKTRVFARPTHVAYRYTNQGHHIPPWRNQMDRPRGFVFDGVSIDFGGVELLETRGGAGWLCYKMSGELQFWFDDQRNHIRLPWESHEPSKQSEEPRKRVKY